MNRNILKSYYAIMKNILKENEPIKNELKKKIVAILSKIYGESSAQVRKMLKLMAKYSYSFKELINIMQRLEKDYFKKFDCNIENYEQQFTRIKRKYRLY